MIGFAENVIRIGNAYIKYKTKLTEKVCIGDLGEYKSDIVSSKSPDHASRIVKHSDCLENHYELEKEAPSQSNQRYHIKDPLYFLYPLAKQIKKKINPKH